AEAGEVMLHDKHAGVAECLGFDHEVDEVLVAGGALDVGNPALRSGAAEKPELHEWLTTDCSLEPILDLGDPGFGAGFVFLASGRAADRDRADPFLADQDRYAAALDRHVGVEHGGIERARN